MNLATWDETKCFRYLPLPWSDRDPQHQNRSIQRCCNGVVFLARWTTGIQVPGVGNDRQPL